MEEQELSDWYHKVLEEADVVDMRYPVKGMIIYKKWGVFIIREMQKCLESMLEEAGHEPCVFPVVIPETILAKETDHIAGFEEQVFWVTHAGKNPLDVRLALRPTSETPIYEMFSLWIRAHTDLPKKVHQSCTVYRYETKHTRPLIRGREFLWNEGHSAHASAGEAEKNIEEIKDIYSRLISDLLCIPFAIDRRPDWDKFPGALATYAFDTIMPDGRTLQIATAHNLGQNFSKVFGIEFDTGAGAKEYAHQTSYGPSFGRLLAALICVHGDGKGLVLPPKVAPVQAVIIPIFFKDKAEERAAILEYAEKVESKLKSLGVRVEKDLGDEHPGAKYYKWEMRGVPLRIEVGPRDLKAGNVMVARRDIKEKTPVPYAELEKISSIFEDISKNLRDKARERFEKDFSEAKDLSDFNSKIGTGIVEAGWCESKDCAAKIEESASILAVDGKENVCVVCGKKGKTIRAAKTY